MGDTEKIKSAEQSEDNLQAIVNSIPGALYRLVMRQDQSIAFSYLSPQAEQMFGLTVEEMMGDSSVFTAQIDTDSLARCYELMAESARDLTPFEVIFSFKVRGELRWFVCQSQPARDSSGVVSWTGQFLNYSQQHEAEVQLLRSQNLLRAAQMQAGLGIWDFDLATGKISWTKEVFSIHGIAPEVGEPDMEGLGKLYHPEDFPKLESAVAKAIETGQGYRFDLRIIRQDTGEIRHIAASGGVMQHPVTKAPLHLYGTIFDVTHRKVLEESLAAARDAAESSARAKSNFLASMSHELRTPLNGIVGMTSLLRSSELDRRQESYCETIHQSAEALIAVVNDILDWSRIEAGKIQLEEIGFELPKLIAGVMNILKPQADSKGIALLQVVAAETLPVLRGDPNRIRQVLLNLGANAIKFTERGSVQFELGVLERRDDKLALRIEVVDTGIGITPQQMKRLFQRFSQADASTTRRFGGSGLGLAISKSLTELMGGKIGVTSQYGAGSTFWIELTLPIDDVQPMEGQEIAVVGLHRTSGKGMRVLIAEDNEVNQYLASCVLTQAGHSIEIAANGLIALNRAKASHFDLILMDCQMPEMDGFEATRRIREGLLRHIPIVGLTASALIDDRTNCLEAGMDDYLTKPYRAEELLAAVDKWAGSQTG